MVSSMTLARYRSSFPDWTRARSLGLSWTRAWAVWTRSAACPRDRPSIGLNSAAVVSSPLRAPFTAENGWLCAAHAAV
jgi:hypothetical protein